MGSEQAKDGISDTASVPVVALGTRREHFPIGTFRYLESDVIGPIRKRAMDLAASHAAERQPDGDSYRVDPDDVDAGLREALSEFARQQGMFSQTEGQNCPLK